MNYIIFLLTNFSAMNKIIATLLPLRHAHLTVQHLLAAEKYEDSEYEKEDINRRAQLYVFCISFMMMPSRCYGLTVVLQAGGGNIDILCEPYHHS